MNFKLTCQNLITKEVEVIELYENVVEANIDLKDIWQTLLDCSISKPSPIIANQKGLSFCFSATNRHELYQVEEYNPILDIMFDVLKPANQN